VSLLPRTSQNHVSLLGVFLDAHFHPSYPRKNDPYITRDDKVPQARFDLHSG
jgi:hypothetical protein